MSAECPSAAWDRYYAQEDAKAIQVTPQDLLNESPPRSTQGVGEGDPDA